jgi:hypothetical protein
VKHAHTLGIRPENISFEPSIPELKLLKSLMPIIFKDLIDDVTHMEFITSFIESIVIHELGDMPSNYTK